MGGGSIHRWCREVVHQLL